MAEDTLAPASPDTTAPEGGSEFESMAIPETYRDSAIGKYKTIGEAFKGYENAQKLIDAKGVIVPGEKATPEEYEKFYNSLGRPEKPEGYKLSPLENLHPELKGASDAEFKALMHKHGISAKQADGLYKDYMNMSSMSLTKRDEKMAADKHSAETALRQEWGAEYGTKLAQAQTIITKFGGTADDFGDLGNNPKVLKVLANIAKNFSEDTFVKGNPPTPNTEAQTKLKNIMLDKKHPYWVDGPGHDEAVKEVLALQESITPNERNATRE